MLTGLILAIPLSFVSSSGAIAVIAVTLISTVMSIWITGRRWRSWGYAEHERDLWIRRGVLIRHLTVVPYGRMQFVDVKQGPIDRLLGLATVQLHTAAAATDARIPLLTEADAERLRTRLTELGEAHASGL